RSMSSPRSIPTIQATRGYVLRVPISRSACSQSSTGVPGTGLPFAIQIWCARAWIDAGVGAGFDSAFAVGFASSLAVGATSSNVGAAAAAVVVLAFIFFVFLLIERPLVSVSRVIALSNPGLEQARRAA